MHSIVTSLYTVPAVLLSYNGDKKERNNAQNVTFNCTADGLPRPKIVWRKDGQLIIVGRKRIISTSQEIEGFRNIPDIQQTTSTLTITDLVRGVDNGSYSCRADNEANIGAILNASYTLVIDLLDEGICHILKYILIICLQLSITTSKLLSSISLSEWNM